MNLVCDSNNKTAHFFCSDLWRCSLNQTNFEREPNAPDEVTPLFNVCSTSDSFILHFYQQLWALDEANGSMKTWSRNKSRQDCFQMKERQIKDVWGFSPSTKQTNKQTYDTSLKCVFFWNTALSCFGFQTSTGTTRLLDFLNVATCCAGELLRPPVVTSLLGVSLPV